MLAARLCLSWGIADVKRWHSEQSKESIDFWQAFDSIEPIGEERRQIAMVCELLSNILANEVVKAGGKVEPRTSDDYMGPRFIATKKPVTPPERQDFSSLGKQLAGLG